MTPPAPSTDTTTTTLSTEMIERFPGWLRGPAEWAQANGLDWILWAGGAVSLFLALRFLRAAIVGVLNSKQDDEGILRSVVRQLAGATRSAYLLALSAGLSAPFLISLNDRDTSILQGVVMVITVVQVAIWVHVLALAILDKALSSAGEDPRAVTSMRSLFGLILDVILFALAGITILNNFGLDATGLLAGLGVGGIAIGLAAQSIFQDLFAGVSIMLDRPFVRGDFITFKGFSGTVEKVGLKATRLKALSGEQLSVTNASLLSNEIQNFKLMHERRCVFRVGVTYQTPHEKLADLPEKITAIVEAREGCRADRCHLSAFGDSAILFECVYYVRKPDYALFMDEQQAIFLNIHKLFEDEAIEFAYPTQTLFVQHEEAPSNNAA